MEWSGGEKIESRSPGSSPTFSIRQCHAHQLLTLQDSDDSIIHLQRIDHVNSSNSFLQIPRLYLREVHKM
jgi:hypothetical protein